MCRGKIYNECDYGDNENSSHKDNGLSDSIGDNTNKAKLLPSWLLV